MKIKFQICKCNDRKRMWWPGMSTKGCAQGQGSIVIYCYYIEVRVLLTAQNTNYPWLHVKSFRCLSILCNNPEALNVPNHIKLAFLRFHLTHIQAFCLSMHYRWMQNIIQWAWCYNMTRPKEQHAYSRDHIKVRMLYLSTRTIGPAYQPAVEIARKYTATWDQKGLIFWLTL